MNELSSLRTETGKTFELDPKLKAGQYCLEARTGPIHYKESYKDTDPWLDLDETYSEPSEIKDIGKVLIYPKMPNIVTVYQDKCGYEIQSRSNPDHVARVELVSIDGQPVSTWLDTLDLKTYARVHPYRVGIWKDFSQAKTAKASTMRWKVTEFGNADKDSHPFAFREVPEVFSSLLTADKPPDLSATKISIQTDRTRIDDKTYFWDELIPRTAVLVDTDFQVTTSTYNDGTTFSNGEYYYNQTSFGLYVGQHYASGYPVMNLWNRFTTLTIVPGSTINSCTVSMKTKSGGTLSTAGPLVRFAAAANPGYPTSYNDYNSMSCTSGVSWLGTFTSGNTWYTSSSLVTPFTEVIQISDYAYGNAVLMLWKGATTNQRVDWNNYDIGTANAAKLSVTWTVPTHRGSGVFVPNVSWLSKSLYKRREI